MSLPALCGAAAPWSFIFTNLDSAEDRVDIIGVTEGGTPQPLTEDGASSQASFSPDGSNIVFAHGEFPGSLQDDRDLWIMNSDGSAQRPLGDVQGIDGPTYSPDGKHIAVSQLVLDGDLASRIFVVDTDGKAGVAATPDIKEGQSSVDTQPAWSPDGDSLALVRRVELQGGDTRSEVWISSWPKPEFNRVYESASIVLGLTWGRTGTELLFTDWETPGATAATQRLLYSLDLDTLTIDKVADSAGPPAVTRGTIVYFEYGDEDPDRSELRAVNRDGNIASVGEFAFNPTGAPRLPRCD